MFPIPKCTKWLTPITAKHSANHYRICVHKYGDECTTWVGDKMVRYYDIHALPDELKENLAIVLAKNDPALMTDDVISRSKGLYLYHHHHDPNILSEIGWRVSDRYYVMIVSRETLNLMRGEDDSRSKSKKES